MKVEADLPPRTRDSMTLTKARAIMELVRPELPLSAGLCVVVGELLALGHLPSIGEALLGLLVGFFISGAAMVTNDYFDLEVDRVNHPHRPLPSGRVTVGELVMTSVALSAAGLVCALILSPPALTLALLFLAIGLAYNWRLKESGLAGNLMVSSSVAITFVFGGVVVGSVNALVLTFSALAFIFDLAEEIAAAALDLEGDEQRAVRSVAMVHGRETALRLSGGLFAAFIVLSVLPFAIGWLGYVYLVLVLLADAALAIFAVRLVRSQDLEDGRKYLRRLYITISFFVAAFMISRLFFG